MKTEDLKKMKNESLIATLKLLRPKGNKSVEGEIEKIETEILRRMEKVE